MGSWGSSLYSSDTALDLKSTVGAVVRLPFEPSHLVELICGAFPDASSNPDDEDHTTFWLVLADQFHRRGIHAPEATARALKIIDSGTDLQVAEALDMSPADRRKRGRQLEELRTRLRQPHPEKPRKTLQNPQPLLFDAGDVLVFPVAVDGHSYNPYLPKAKWVRAGWGAAVILTSDRAFGYLAFYCPIVLVGCPLGGDSPPTLEDLLRHREWRLDDPGTCSRSHAQRMQLEKVGRVALDPQRVREKLPGQRAGDDAAVNDISIANRFYIVDGQRYREESRIGGLAEIATTST
jgi:hypothetical protein